MWRKNTTKKMNMYDSVYKKYDENHTSTVAGRGLQECIIRDQRKLQMLNV